MGFAETAVQPESILCRWCFAAFVPAAAGQVFRTGGASARTKAALHHRGGSVVTRSGVLRWRILLLHRAAAIRIACGVPPVNFGDGGGIGDALRTAPGSTAVDLLSSRARESAGDRFAEYHDTGGRISGGTSGTRFCGRQDGTAGHDGGGMEQRRSRHGGGFRVFLAEGSGPEDRGAAGSVCMESGTGVRFRRIRRNRGNWGYAQWISTRSRSIWWFRRGYF